MAKTKKVNEERIPALVVTPDKAPVVAGNFEDVTDYLVSWQKRISKFELTEDNMELVKSVKKEASAYRISLNGIMSDVKKRYFNNPKQVFEAKMAQLLSLVSEVEGLADNVLQKEEDERVAEVNQILDMYKSELQKTYKLEDEYLARIEYKKQYYNKTSSTGKSRDKENKDDLTQQFKVLKKEQDAVKANVMLITALCKDDERLNAQFFIEMLSRDDLDKVIDAVNAEKERFKNLSVDVVSDAEIVDDEPPLQSVGVKGVTVFKDVDLTSAMKNYKFNSDFESVLKTASVEITYPCDLSEELTKLFKALEEYHIAVEFVNEPRLVS